MYSEFRHIFHLNFIVVRNRVRVIFLSFSYNIKNNNKYSNTYYKIEKHRYNEYNRIFVYISTQNEWRKQIENRRTKY
jgi:hypothetical protein